MSQRRIVRPSILALALALLAAAAPPAISSGAEACADGHLGLRWGRWREPLTNSSYPLFYFAGEDESSVTVTVQGVGHDCTVPKQPVTGTYEVRDYPQDVPNPADGFPVPLDYQPVTGTVSLYGFDGPPPSEHSREVAITQDLSIEAVAEQAQAVITPVSGRVEEPWDVPVQIIDDDGLSRVAFHSGEPRTHSESYPALSVAVLRAGPADAAESFAFTVEGSSASPAGAEDFVVVTQPLAFAAGERIALIELEVVNDAISEPTEELTITLTEPGPLLPEAGDATTVSLKILDNEEADGEGGPPSSRFHHPRHKVQYERGDYRLREFHVFANDEGGDVTGVELALRQRLTSGRCAWYTGNRFARGACSSKRWLAAEYHPDLDWYYYSVGKLRPSVGTSIKGYTAFARATDGAGNTERRLQRGRNANTFEVEKK